MVVGVSVSGDGGTYRVWGGHVAQEVLESSPERVEKVFVDKRKVRKHSDLLQLARNHGIPVVVGVFQHGIGVQLAAVQFEPLENVATLKLGIVLAGVTDEGNLGAIFRTAAAFGVDFVLLPKRRVGSISPRVVYISQGGVYKVKVVRDNLQPALEWLKEQGYWVYAADPRGAEKLYDVQFAEKAVLVLGDEHRGIPRGILREADATFRIPMYSMESLNVSVSAGIVLYEYRRQWR